MCVLQPPGCLVFGWRERRRLLKVLRPLDLLQLDIGERVRRVIAEEAHLLNFALGGDRGPLHGQ